MWNLISHFLTFAGGMASGVILNPAIQRGANLHEYLRGDMTVASHLGN